MPSAHLIVRISAHLTLVLLVNGRICGQEQTSAQNAGMPGIQDNSFLIEEAYNQEEGVVQHISSLSFGPIPQKNLTYVFTQEWPLGGQVHQISYTISYNSFDGGRIHGLGDVLINYRHQLFADGDWAYVAPRLSVILPTGSENEGLGNGVTGVQMSIPASKEISRAFVIHANAGFTIIPRAKVLVSYYTGGSLIWRAGDAVHFMLETLVFSHAETAAGGDIVRETGIVISPGLRFALNFPKLQIVPGAGFPISAEQGATSASLFLYLSFEHPF